MFAVCPWTLLSTTPSIILVLVGNMGSGVFDREALIY